MTRFRSKKFELFNFDDLYIRFEKDKVELNEKKLDEGFKEKIKKDKFEEDRTFGYAIVDNLIEKLNGYKIEQPSLLKGRGEHPLTGTLKARIYPEDVTINIGEKAPIPICPMKGHCWGSLVHNH